MDVNKAFLGSQLEELLKKIRSCSVCKNHLPLGPNPIIRGTNSSRLLIISQAPGTRVHETGLSFNDASGDRLRAWLQLDRASFYDEKQIAIMPMGMCYPGRNIKGGDLPPRPECAPLWHEKVQALLPNVKLTLLVGSYAQRYYLDRTLSLTDCVRRWRHYLPTYIPLPHPSWRNNAWIKTNPWFEEELI
ncbi:MAG: uracil-DNA glycosylase family protein, partial [Alphaproteobacteria bacterium]|nr:uracil-DNA glycosylase family protein [Alphaproteobacteria bacterium]